MNWQDEINTLLKEAPIADDPRALAMVRGFAEMLRDETVLPVHGLRANIERYERLDGRVAAQLGQFLTALQGFEETPDDDYYVRLYACLNVTCRVLANVWNRLGLEYRHDLNYAMARAMMVGIEVGRRT